MRNFMVIAAVGTTLWSSAAGAQGAAAADWRPMTVHDLRAPSREDPLQTLVWPDVIARANDYVTTTLKRPLNGQNAYLTALSSTYQDAARTIIVSMILHDCDNGANDKGAEIEPSVCPLRIVVIEAGKVVLTKTETGCYADHADPDLPAKNRNDDSYTRFDAKSGTVGFRTNVGGSDVASCARTYSIK
jgi:hypothetical protein